MSDRMDQVDSTDTPTVYSTDPDTACTDEPLDELAADSPIQQSAPAKLRFFLLIPLLFYHD